MFSWGCRDAFWQELQPMGATPSTLDKWEETQGYIWRIRNEDLLYIKVEKVWSWGYGVWTDALGNTTEYERSK